MINNLEQMLEHYQGKVDFYENVVKTTKCEHDKGLAQKRLEYYVGGFCALSKVKQLEIIDQTEASSVWKSKQLNKTFNSF